MASRYDLFIQNNKNNNVYVKHWPKDNWNASFSAPVIDTLKIISHTKNKL